MRISTARLAILFCLMILCQQVFAQNFWKTAASNNTVPYLERTASSSLQSGQFDLFDLDLTGLQNHLRQVINQQTGSAQPVSFAFTLPKTGQGWQETLVEESAIVSPEVAALISHVKTFTVKDKTTKKLLGRITITDKGVTAFLFTDKGTQYIHPLQTSSNTHISFLTKNLANTESILCGVNTDAAGLINSETELGKASSGDGRLRTYRVAISATGEYVSWAGNFSNALASVVITMNNVNAIYEREVAVRLQLVSGTEAFFTDAATDPFGNDLTAAILNSNDSLLDIRIGAGNYDVGMVFSRGWNGGLAQLNSTCGASKARSGSGLTFGTGANPVAGPQGPVFDNVVAHEFAHQFSATHTMSSNTGGCAGNSSPGSAWETGGGSTIMAYAGVCTGTGYQSQSDDYFHAGSIAQITNFVNSGAGSSCAVVSALSNTLPDLTVVGTSFSIPPSTPFRLWAIGNDEDANPLTYAWDQMNALVISGYPSASNTSGPNFRSLPPSTSGTRYFPNLTSLLNGTSAPEEILPSVTRTMNFRVLVRDNNSGAGANIYEDVAINTVAGSGPFTVTSQNAAVNYVANGTNTMTVTWNVAGTTAAPFNVSQVEILYSNSGENFQVIHGPTANDGSEEVVVPNLPGQAGRLMVRSVGNVFFNINAAPIGITSACRAEAAEIIPDATVTAAPGAAALNLNLNPEYGQPFPFTGSVIGSDPSTGLPLLHTGEGVCYVFTGNVFRFKTTELYVSITGSYTFTRTGTNSPMYIYKGSFDPISNPCANMVGYNFYYDGTAAPSSNSMTATLEAGVKYIMAVGTFNASTSLPLNFNIAVTASPATSVVSTGYLAPGVDFSYQYVIVNNSTGKIVEIKSTADLSNAAVYGSGIYSVYGISSENASLSLAELNAFEGNDFSALQQELFTNPAASCGALSRNFVTVNIFGALPVELLPLTATVATNKIDLNWATAMELNSDYFLIEKSTDGTSFETIGKLQAAGESNQQRNYTFADKEPAAGSNYYRIKAISKDSEAQYSNTVMVKWLINAFKAQLFPNPSANRTTLQLQMPEAATVKISVYSANGATIEQRMLNLQGGNHNIPFDWSQKASGLYMVVIQINEEINTIRFVKQ